MSELIKAGAIRQKPGIVRQINGGGQAMFRFANGYGASIIMSSSSYGGNNGLFELAVITFTGGGFDDWNWSLCYDTPVTDDVIGWLEADELQELLDKIEALPARGQS